MEQKQTKIICTIGPACADEKTLTEMVEAGMNVARFNFSHGTQESQRKTIELVKSVREKTGQPIALMLDTKGPEYRIGTFKNGSITLTKGDAFSLTTRKIEGDETCVSVSYAGTVKELSVGDRVLINNGLVTLQVETIEGKDAHCRVIDGGVLSDHKSMSFPGKVLGQVYLSEQDKADLLLGIEMDVDFIAASFVSGARDVQDMRDFLNANGGSEIDIIAKIENRSGVEHVVDIINVADGIMVARGDLGVEIPYEELPSIQKHVIKTCRMCGKRVITATEMLESMTENPRPTRAEISDVANAVYDGTSALMLSGETAAGKYPVAAVQAMSRIARQTELNIDYKYLFRHSDFVIANSNDAMSHAACALALDVEAKAIVVCTRSGKTARLVSRFRVPKPILGMTTSRKVWNKLALSWGVIPQMSGELKSVDVLLYYAANIARESGLVQKGDKVIVTAGVTNGQSGNTDLIKMEEI